MHQIYRIFRNCFWILIICIVLFECQYIGIISYIYELSTTNTDGEQKKETYLVEIGWKSDNYIDNGNLRKYTQSFFKTLSNAQTMFVITLITQLGLLLITGIFLLITHKLLITHTEDGGQYALSTNNINQRRSIIAFAHVKRGDINTQAQDIDPDIDTDDELDDDQLNDNYNIDEDLSDVSLSSDNNDRRQRKINHNHNHNHKPQPSMEVHVSGNSVAIISRVSTLSDDAIEKRNSESFRFPDDDGAGVNNVTQNGAGDAVHTRPRDAAHQSLSGIDENKEKRKSNVLVSSHSASALLYFGWKVKLMKNVICVIIICLVIAIVLSMVWLFTVCLFLMY